MPDEQGVLTLDELAAFEPPTQVFDPEVMEFPEIGLRVRVRGLRTPRELAYVQQIQTQWSVDNPMLRQKLIAAVREVDPEADVTNGMIATWSWVHACLVPMFPMEHVARLAAKTGGAVERIGIRAMQKSMIMGSLIETLKNVSAVAVPIPVPTPNGGESSP